MGYKPQKVIYNLEFADMPGLEVSVIGTSIGKLLDLSKTPLSFDSKNEEKIQKVFSFFSKRIMTWNVEHPEIENEDDEVLAKDEESGQDICPKCGLIEGQLMPTTMQSMMCLEQAFVMQIVFGWMTAIASVSLPKGSNMSDGGLNIQEELLQRLSELQQSRGES